MLSWQNNVITIEWFISVYVCLMSYLNILLNILYHSYDCNDKIRQIWKTSLNRRLPRLSIFGYMGVINIIFFKLKYNSTILNTFLTNMQERVFKPEQIECILFIVCFLTNNWYQMLILKYYHFWLIEQFACPIICIISTQMTHVRHIFHLYGLHFIMIQQSKKYYYLRLCKIIVFSVFCFFSIHPFLTHYPFMQRMFVNVPSTCGGRFIILQ